MAVKQKTEVAINLGKLQDKQKLAYRSNSNEILYGGAAGGGKSHFMRVASIRWCTEIPGLMVYLFRRLSDDLDKNHVEGPSGYANLLHPFIEAGLVKYNQQKRSFTFWNGSKIFLNHCQHEKDLKKYQGPEIHVLMIDELTHFSENMYTFLRNRIRMTGVKIPDKYYYLCDICDGKGVVEFGSEYAINPNSEDCSACGGEGRACVFPRALSGTNPGSEGHNWVKKMFVDFSQPEIPKRAPVKGGGMYRQYIPAKLSDNKALMDSDPGYANKIKGMSSNPGLVKAMLDGDWNIVSGGAFDDLWQYDKHVIPSLKINPDWYVDRSFDWGTSDPFSVLFVAESNGEPSYFSDGTEFCPPAGSLVVFNEIYGEDENGNGLKLSSAEMCTEIKNMEKTIQSSQMYNGQINPGPADNQIHNNMEKGVPTIASKMESKGVKWTRSNKSPGTRIIGFQLVRDMLKATRDNTQEAHLYFTSNCVKIIANLPVLPRCSKNPEDVNTKANDHDYDALRYRILSRFKGKLKTKKMRA